MEYYPTIINSHIVPIERLEGKIITEITKSSDNDALYFMCSNGECYILGHKQSCCEQVYRDIVKYFKKEYKVDENEVLIEIKKTNKRRKRVYNSEYINYVCNKFNVQYLELLPVLRNRFKIYKDFLKYCREK